jgi:hypothetical protein
MIVSYCDETKTPNTDLDLQSFYYFAFYKKYTSSAVAQFLKTYCSMLRHKLRNPKVSLFFHNFFLHPSSSYINCRKSKLEISFFWGAFWLTRIGRYRSVATDRIILSSILTLLNLLEAEWPISDDYRLQIWEKYRGISDGKRLIACLLRKNIGRKKKETGRHLVGNICEKGKKKQQFY